MRTARQRKGDERVAQCISTLRLGELREEEMVRAGGKWFVGLRRRLPWLLMLLKFCTAVMLDERLKGLSGAAASDLYSAV